MSSSKFRPARAMMEPHQQQQQQLRNFQLGAKHMVKAHLPNQQHTMVRIPAGMTVREALSKALKTRKLEPEMCSVFKYSPQTQAKQRIDWDVDVSMLQGNEILVETKDRVPMYTQLSHNFAKSFFTLSKCVFCNDRLMTGYRCVTCGIEFHKRCGSAIPPLCEPAMENRDIFRHMLARSNGFSPTSPHSTGDSPIHNVIRPVRPRAKSADENAKHKSKLGLNTNDSQTDHQQVISFNSNNDTHDKLRSQHHNRNGTLSPNLGSISNHSISQQYIQQQQQNHPTKPPQHQHHLNLPTATGIQPELLEEKWEIYGSEITVEATCIGRGSFGTVYKGMWHGPVAVKQLNVKNPTPAQLEAFQNEVVVLKSTRHNNVMLFMGYVLNPGLSIVTQWCEGRSLFKHLHADKIPGKDDDDFSIEKIIDIARGVAQGMEYLHAKNIIHRDLKSSNIFLHDDLSVKIGDFGLATVKTRWEGNTQKHHPTGSILWMAPEVIRTRPGLNPFTFRSDVYSYGNVLYELLTRQLPYFDFRGGKEALLYQIGAGIIGLNLSVIKPDRPIGLKHLMLKCTFQEVNNRPLFKDILLMLNRIDLKVQQLLRTTSEPLRLNNLHEAASIENF